MLGFIIIVFVIWSAFTIGLSLGCTTEVPNHWYGDEDFDIDKVWMGPKISARFDGLRYNYQKVLFVVIGVVLVPLICGPMTFGRWLFKEREL